MNKTEILENESVCDTVIHSVSDWAEGIATDAEIQALHEAWRVVSDRVQANELPEEVAVNIDIMDLDRTKHVCINGWIDRPRDCLLIEWGGWTKVNADAEQTYSQEWRIAYLGEGFDRAEVESIIRNHFYAFQECGEYQSASVSGRTITVSGGLDI